jgi:signal transduction histidine kinase
VKKNYSNDIPPIQGNEGKLHQVFFNILSNSEQSIDDKGMISISTNFLNSEVIITFSDTGSGISKELISRITEPFFTTKDPGKGVGLGLSMAYSIVMEHKGRMIFDSEKGVGTSVIISLPIKCE